MCGPKISGPGSTESDTGKLKSIIGVGTVKCPVGFGIHPQIRTGEDVTAGFNLRQHRMESLCHLFPYLNLPSNVILSEAKNLAFSICLRSSTSFRMTEKQGLPGYIGLSGKISTFPKKA
jgi:hypothetical protein